MKSDAAGFEVRQARWPEDAEGIRHVRDVVFIQEQAVPASLEWDGSDDECTHAVAVTADGKAIGTGRLAPDGKVGRMAVLAEYRGLGVGAAILDHLLETARAAGMNRCYLHAQTHALDFYARHGFVAHGAEFIEADIPHQEMELALEAQ